MQENNPGNSEWFSDDPLVQKRLSRMRERLLSRDFEEKHHLLQLSEISLVLDTYDDIFSDFDPRHYRQRSISDDLLSELKRATRDNKQTPFQLRFLIPLEKKRAETEVIIKKRLKEHFKRHFDLVSKEINSIRRLGGLMILIGLFLSIIAAVYLYPSGEGNILMNILLVLIEPAAWFTIWEGANKITDTWKIKEPELAFYRGMKDSDIVFTTY